MVHGYGYKPAPRRQLLPSERLEQDTLFLGLEIELGLRYGSREAASDVVDQTGLPIYCKTDASIGYGLELVTHPMTPAFLQSQPVQKSFKRLFKTLRDDFGGKDKQSCGIHIHLSKAAFTPSHLYRFMRLIYDHPESVFRFSGRTRRQMSQYCTLGEPELQSARKAAGDTYGGRFVAVNTSCANTVEVRLFSSACYPGPFNRRIEFVLAAYEFTKVQTSAKRVTWINFRRFVCNRPSQFKQLSKWFRADATKRGVDLEAQLAQSEEINDRKREFEDYYPTFASVASF